MFIELVDSLRCVNVHEDTWLVAAVARMDGRHIVDGTLGCPLCRREYPIRDGVGWFVDPDSARGSARLTPLSASAPEARVMRAAALLGRQGATDRAALASSSSCTSPELRNAARSSTFSS